jgi:hypothetical protein
MEKSKLKSFEKLMINNVHATWVNDKNKTNWKFTVEFENGDKGTAMKMNEEGKGLDIGTEYVYEKSKNGNYTNIKGMKDANSTFAGGNGPKSSYNDPLSIARWSKCNSLAISNKISWILKDMDKKTILKSVLLWISIDETKNDKDLSILRRTVIEDVIEDFHKQFNDTEPTLEEILDKATSMWNYVIK